jgi:hypothetical protein
MPTNSQRLPRLTVLLLVLATGVVFCTVHILNGWLLEFVEVTAHISLLYLPSFLRIVNVLVLGTLWGTVGTAIGGALLCVWSEDSLLLGTLNTAISAGSAALAVWCMQVFQQRPLSLTRLSDLMQLALFNALLNALFHHFLWAQLDPSQLISKPSGVHDDWGHQRCHRGCIGPTLAGQPHGSCQLRTPKSNSIKSLTHF